MVITDRQTIEIGSALKAAIEKITGRGRAGGPLISSVIRVKFSIREI